MNKDMCVACDDGILNIRVGAIIMKDGKILMVGNDRDYLYSVGGRVKFGETAEEAVAREIKEETVRCWRKQAFRWKMTALALCMKTISMATCLPIGTS